MEKNLSLSHNNQSHLVQSCVCKELHDVTELTELHNLIKKESMSQGGVLRDTSIFELQRITTIGYVMGALFDGSLIGGLTLEPCEGENQRWWYINRGVTQQDFRSQGVAQNLIHYVVTHVLPRDPMFVISLTRRPFLENGFIEVSQTDFIGVDPTIKNIIIQKIRNGTSVTVFLRNSQKGSL